MAEKATNIFKIDKNNQKGRAIALRTAVNLSEMKISNNPAETLVAFSIGSGIGMTIYDPVSAVGGMLNFILPSTSSINSEKAEKYPFMFADTGVPAFIGALTDSGAMIEKMKVVIAGAAQILDQTSVFNIGHKNYEMTISILSAYKLAIHHEDIGGVYSRRLSLNIGSGYSFINIAGQSEIKI